MDRSNVRGIPPPNKHERRRYVVGPRWGKQVRCIFLAADVFGCHIHFLDNWTRQYPCLEGRCRYCSHGLGWEYKAFAPVQSIDTPTLFIVEMTEQATRNALAVAGGDGRSMRGLKLRLYRTGPRKNAPVEIEFLGWADDEVLPAAWDVVPELEQRWGVRLSLPDQAGTDADVPLADVGDEP